MEAREPCQVRKEAAISGYPHVPQGCLPLQPAGKIKDRPAVVTAANKKSATGKRIAAVILWVLALAAEVGAILMLNGRWYIPEDQKMYWLIGALVIDLILVIIGSQLWKKSNRLDPASKQNSVKFFLWNNMGFIAAVVCFLPVVILLLANKDLDAKTKKIVTVVAVIALILASVFSIDFNPVSAEELAEAQQTVGNGSVYWTQFGKSYHLDPNCHTLMRSSKVYQGTIEEAFEANRTDPCDFCALEKDGN